MKGQKLKFKIDRLTECIENIRTGDVLQTQVREVSENDLVKVNKANKWVFSWKKERKKIDATVYKLTVLGNPQVIQGLISLTEKSDHIFMNLIESSPFNRGKDKVYAGVMANLVAYGCLRSFELGKGGYLAFRSKTKLIQHYEKTLGAIHFGGHLMVLTPENSLSLVRRYYED